MATSADECVTIVLQDTRSDRREFYGITHEGVVRHTVTGPGLHNRSFPHRVQVWSNTGRPNPHPGEVRWTEYGSIGGPGQYLDPRNKGTDDPATVYLASESVGIYAVYTEEDRRRAMEGEPLRVGQRVRLLYPDGTLSEPYVITAGHLSDPSLIPAE